MEGNADVVGGWSAYKEIKKFRGMCVNNEGVLKGIILAPQDGTENISKGTSIGIFGENYDLTTFDGFSFPLGYNGKSKHLLLIKFRSNSYPL